MKILLVKKLCVVMMLSDAATNQNDKESKPIKCVVVGNGGVGKTCLLITYATDNGWPGEYIPTVYDNYTKEHKLKGNVKQKFKIHLWDTAGQEDYDRLRPLSYPETDVFLICFGINNRWSFECVTQMWIPEITHHCGGTPFLIIGCKDDLRDSIIYKNKEQINVLVHGYMHDHKVNIPMEIWDIIENYVYVENKDYYAGSYKDNLVTNEEAQKLSEDVGAYKYLYCSALEFRGLNEIFDEVCECYRSKGKSARKRKGKSRCILL